MPNYNPAAPIALTGVPPMSKENVIANIAALQAQMAALPARGTQNEYGYNLNAGFGTVPMRSGLAATLVTSGLLYLGLFRAPKTETENTVQFGLNTIASGGTITLTRFGVWTVDSTTGALLALAASTPNDIALCTSGASTGVRKTKALSAPFNAVRDSWYALGFLFVGTGTAPQIQFMLQGGGGGNNMPLGGLPRINGFISGLTDLPASATGAQVLSGQNVMPWAELTP